MKRLTFAILCAANAFLPALAQDGEDAAMAEAKTKAASQIKLADKNADGSLTIAELRGARYDLRKALIAAREDKAKTKELNEASRGLPEFQVFLAADVNNDFKLTVEELAAHLVSESDNKRWRLSDKDLELLAQETGQDRWDWAMAQRDADSDSHLAASEADLRSDKDKQEFAAADLDKDGLLSNYEFMKYGIERFKEKAKPKVEKARAEFKDVVANDDPFALYKKKGRTWMHKYTTKLEGMDDMISYMKNEITEVTETGATMKMYMFDKDKKPMAGMEEGTETKIEFRKVEIPGGQPPAPEVEDGGIIEAAGRKWATQKFTTKAGGSESTSWMAVELPGLLIKFESTSDNFSTTGVLEEFSDGE